MYMAFMCEQSSGECDACGACSAARPALACDCCGESVYPGDDFWALGGFRYCEDCVMDARREAQGCGWEEERDDYA